jgi:hypothetical protein
MALFSWLSLSFYLLVYHPYAQSAKAEARFLTHPPRVQAKAYKSLFCFNVPETYIFKLHILFFDTEKSLIGSRCLQEPGM